MNPSYNGAQYPFLCDDMFTHCDHSRLKNKRRPKRFWTLLLLFIPWQVFAVPTDTDISVWVNEAIVATYTFNYQNFLARQKDIAHYFTAEGWISYSKALNDAKLFQSVQKNAYSVSAVALLPPVIKTMANRQWQAVMPLLVLYKNSQYQQKQTLQVTLTFTAAPVSQGMRGLAITSLSSKVIEPPCQCNGTYVKPQSLR